MAVKECHLLRAYSQPHDDPIEIKDNHPERGEFQIRRRRSNSEALVAPDPGGGVPGGGRWTAKHRPIKKFRYRSCSALWAIYVGSVVRLRLHPVDFSAARLLSGVTDLSTRGPLLECRPHLRRPGIETTLRPLHLQFFA